MLAIVAQHHGLATRLLRLDRRTRSLALWFAF
jgi:hypothetical protein